MLRSRGQLPPTSSFQLPPLDAWSLSWPASDSFSPSFSPTFSSNSNVFLNFESSFVGTGQQELEWWTQSPWTPQRTSPILRSGYRGRLRSGKDSAAILPPPNSLTTINGRPDTPDQKYSRKVFVGGLPPDIDQNQIAEAFSFYGTLVVDWPHKMETKSHFPPKGYAFVIFERETSVHLLLNNCYQDSDKYYTYLSSLTIKDKPVQIRPWKLTYADFVLDSEMPLDPRKTVFIGGVPRPLKAQELGALFERAFGGVCYAGVDTDPELKYPKGAGRVAFNNHQSYIASIRKRFVTLSFGDINKQVEVKPYVLDDQVCDECRNGGRGGRAAPFFCANVACLQYYCESCWDQIHVPGYGRECHKPLVKDGLDKHRGRWPCP